MRVLIVGGGGREHALAWKAAKSPKVARIYCAPGNAGMAELGDCVPIEPTDIGALTKFACEKIIDVTLIGPEAPLFAGITDELRGAGVVTFGPNKEAAFLEESKARARLFMTAHDIPQPDHWIATDPQSAIAYVEDWLTNHYAVVIKASGPALGKGAYVCHSLDDARGAIQAIMVDKVHGPAGNEVVIEECLVGQEVSVIGVTDGVTFEPLTPVRDYKRLNPGDIGPMTGGMGGYAPVSYMTHQAQVLATIIQPTLRALYQEGNPYTGALYVGIMLTDKGPKVLEFNTRFGDPETQVSIPLLESDLVETAFAVDDGELADYPLARSADKKAVGVVLASAGYPGSYEKGKVITGLKAAGKMENVCIFHAGTALQDGQIVTSGGRVLTVVGIGDDYRLARERAYAAADYIKFEGKYCRDDIGPWVPEYVYRP